MIYDPRKRFHNTLRYLTATVLLCAFTLTTWGQNPNSKISFNVFDSNKNVFKELLSAYILLDSAAKDKYNQPHKWQRDDTLTDSWSKYTVIGFPCVSYDTNYFHGPFVVVGKCFCDTVLKDRLLQGGFEHHAKRNYFEWPLGWGGTAELMIMRKNNNSTDTMTIGFKSVPNQHFGIDISFSAGKYVLDLKDADSNYYPRKEINKKYNALDITPKDWSKNRAFVCPLNIDSLTAGKKKNKYDNKGRKIGLWVMQENDNISIGEFKVVTKYPQNEAPWKYSNWRGEVPDKGEQPTKRMLKRHYRKEHGFFNTLVHPPKASIPIGEWKYYHCDNTPMRSVLYDRKGRQYGK